MATPAHADVFDRLHDDGGDVPGLRGWKLKRKPAPNRCGGIEVIVIRGKQPLSPDEEPLAALFALEFPKGLSFSPDEKARKLRQSSMKRFDEFMKTATRLAETARKFYNHAVDTEKTLEARAKATARLAQASFRIASLLARAEISSDVRTGEFAADKIEAFCTQLADHAEVLLENAESSAEVCAKAFTTANAPAGWWTAVCVP